MTALLQFAGLENTALPPRPLHLAIGMFDGVHLGHQSVIESAIHSARRSGGLAGVLTFWPHPSAFFRPDHPTPQILAPEMKRRVLGGLGLDFLIEQPFTREFAAVEAAEFVPLLRHRLPQLAAVYVGDNWRFGRGRVGDVAFLVNAAPAAGLAVFSIPRLSHNGAPISSSRIRDLLATGAMAEANALLGYSYFAEGRVQPGRRLGRTIGFPTLNLAWEPPLRPRYGVYAVEVLAAGQPPAPGVANYGLRPTVETAAVSPLLEVHLLEPTRLDQGDQMTVHWLHFLRPEAKFGSLEELRRQIARDRDNALSFHRKTAPGNSPNDA
ncbi:MAG: riboflavin biosynthesis protein RibF [Opitutaceae bacterium]|nr:riboflavin biosynthesis protein RibF [Opitutaceae bacterium]